MHFVGVQKMDIAKRLRLSAASLILLAGIIHLTLTAFTTGMEMGVLALSGVLYVIIGIGLFTGNDSLVM